MKALKGFGFSLSIGILSGVASAFFLFCLEKVSVIREANTFIIWTLPLAGLLSGLAYHYYGKKVDAGSNLILAEIYDRKTKIPFRMMPMVLIATLWTHLFGGSVGREGTAIQMGGAIGDMFGRFLHEDKEGQKNILLVGLSGGFGSVFGVPWAGSIFALEVVMGGAWRAEHLGSPQKIGQRFLYCVIASWVGHLSVQVLGIHHFAYSPWQNLFNVTPSFILMLIILGVCFGLAARFYLMLYHRYSRFLKHRITFLPFRVFVGGLLVIAGYYLLHTFRYAGLGTNLIAESFHQVLEGKDFFYKSIFTVLTVGAGFKGGEVTPLFAIGASLGSYLSGLLPSFFGIMTFAPLTGCFAALGLVAVFAGTAGVPLTCTVMAMELFGVSIFFPAIVVCYLSYLICGKYSLYEAQILPLWKRR